jgi:hypothetical protein
MTNNTKLRKTAAALTRLLALTTLFAGCGSSSSDGAGGSTGTPSAGAGASGSASASAGAAAAGTTGAAGSTTSVGGSTSAGGAGSASTSACGPKCTAASTCTPAVIPSGLTSVTDFSNNLDAGHVFHASGDASDWTGLFGGTWVSPKASDPCAAIQLPPLTESFSDGNWHITGNIVPNQWSGAGLWFATGAACPVFDFSAYSGISFTVAGNAGPSGSVSVTVTTASNSAPNTDKTSASFTCFSNAATCSVSSCSAPSMTVSSITTTPQTVKVMFADLKGGAPVSSADKKEITGIGINPTIDWSGSGTAYSLDLTIDDLTLIP